MRAHIQGHAALERVGRLRNAGACACTLLCLGFRVERESPELTQGEKEQGKGHMREREREEREKREREVFFNHKVTDGLKVGKYKRERERERERERALLGTTASRELERDEEKKRTGVCGLGFRVVTREVTTGPDAAGGACCGPRLCCLGFRVHTSVLCKE